MNPPLLLCGDHHQREHALKAFFLLFRADTLCLEFLRARGPEVWRRQVPLQLQLPHSSSFLRHAGVCFYEMHYAPNVRSLCPSAAKKGGFPAGAAWP